MDASLSIHASVRLHWTHPRPPVWLVWAQSRFFGRFSVVRLELPGAGPRRANRRSIRRPILSEASLTLKLMQAGVPNLEVLACTGL